MQRQLEEYDEALVRQEREAQTLKRKQWQEIQNRAPATAEFLKELSSVFGKVKLLSVEFLDTGQQ
jgi:hypothetical protein